MIIIGYGDIYNPKPNSWELRQVFRCLGGASYSTVQCVCQHSTLQTRAHLSNV